MVNHDYKTPPYIPSPMAVQIAIEGLAAIQPGGWRRSPDDMRHYAEQKRWHDDMSGEGRTRGFIFWTVVKNSIPD